MKPLKKLLSSPLFRHVLSAVVLISLVRTGVITPDEARTLNATAQHIGGA